MRTIRLVGSFAVIRFEDGALFGRAIAFRGGSRSDELGAWVLPLIPPKKRQLTRQLHCPAVLLENLMTYHGFKIQGPPLETLDDLPAPVVRRSSLATVHTVNLAGAVSW